MCKRQFSLLVPVGDHSLALDLDLVVVLLVGSYHHSLLGLESVTVLTEVPLPGLVARERTTATTGQITSNASHSVLFSKFHAPFEARGLRTRCPGIQVPYGWRPQA